MPPPGVIHVWLWQVSDTPLSHEELLPLSPAEQQRAARFRVARHRALWVRSHTGMRSILAAYLGLSAPEVRFRRDTHGKPGLDVALAVTSGTAAALAFNLSHSEDWCGLAIASDMQVGLDIQVPHEIDTHLWRRVLTPAEHLEMNALPRSEQDAAFFRGWTRKEALGKAEGRGVYPHLRRTTTGLGAVSGPFTVDADNGAGALLRWHLHDLPSIPGLFGVVASSHPAELQIRPAAFPLEAELPGTR
jgi:4'-phosphopantetheinyl transferase